MTLKQQLQDDLKSAMRDRDDARKRALRMVLAAIKMREVEVRGELSDADVLAILQKEARQRLEVLDELSQVDRPDLVAAEQADLEILEEYLPQQLNREQIAELARQVVSDVGAKGQRDMGQVMRALMPQVKGRADGQLVNQVVRELLSE